jgi:hypothetical protein
MALTLCASILCASRRTRNCGLGVLGKAGLLELARSTSRLDDMRTWGRGEV